MKLKNELMIICLILFILISVSAVSAADNNTEIITTNNINDNVLSIDSNNENSLSNGNDGSFADLNIAVNGDSSTNIILDRNYSYSSKDTIKDGIVINKNNMVIDGQGHVIDAKGQSRIFYVNSTTVYLKNIIFKDGYSFNKSGGAVYSYGDNLRVINCTFIDNIADSWGGAIYSCPDSYTAVVNSTFRGNHAKYGGAIGTVYGNRHDIINSTFDANYAVKDGGAIAIYGELGTTERPYDDKVNIRGCVFTNNKADRGDAIANTLSTYINMTNSIILGNHETSIYSWGAMFFTDYNWWGNTVDNKSVKPNNAKGLRYSNWLYLDFVPDVSTCTATVSINNLYDNKTGEVSTYSTSKLPPVNVKFSADNATFDVDNAYLDNSGKFKVNFIVSGDSTLTANCEGVKVSKDIEVSGLSELALLIRNTPDNNIIKLDKDYVYTQGVDRANSRILITNKHDLVIDGNGHTINALGKTMLFAVDKDSSNIIFKNMKIVNAFSNDEHDGPAAYILSINTQFINCTFVNNTANGIGAGGALNIHTDNATITDCRFIDNSHMSGSGGAVYVRGDNFNIINTLFVNNTANSYHGHAGALYMFDGGNVYNCTFVNNTADFAGAIFNYNHATIDECTFIDNAAIGDVSQYEDGTFCGGGAIYAADDTITNSRFFSNTGRFGAAIAFTSSGLTVDRCLFINNTATSPNGIIFGGAEGGSVSNSIFLNNHVKYGYIISTIFGKLKADYNWFGNLGKDYNKVPDVSNLAIMTKWLFLNATQPEFTEEGKNLTISFGLFEYDSRTNQVIPYDYEDLPPFNLTISTQNLTIDKNEVIPEEVIFGNLTYEFSYGEDGIYYRFDNKGTITATYENVKYVVPFKFERKSWFESNSTIQISKGETKFFDYILHPFESSYVLFLVDAGRITFVVNDTNVVQFSKSKLYIKGLKVGLASIFIKFDGKDVMGKDRYVPSNTTILINVTRSSTHIVNSTSIPTQVEVGDSSYFIIGLKDFNNKTVSRYEFEFINHNPDILQLAAGGNHVDFRALKEGTARITVKFNGNMDYLPASRDFIIEVLKKDPQLKVEPDYVEMNVSKDYYVGIYTRSSENFSYISNDTNVAIMEENVIHAIGPGIANITVRFNGDEKYRPAEEYIIVKVTGVPTYIDLHMDSNVQLLNNTTLYMNPSLKDFNNKIVSNSFKATSNDTNVVAVDEYGSLHAVGLGSAKITITFNPRFEYYGATTYLTVNVYKETNSISVNSSIDMHVKQRINLNATLEHKDSLIYSSNDTSVVSVDKWGYIHSNKAGVAQITVKYAGTGSYWPDTKYVIVTVTTETNYIDVVSSVDMHVNDKIKLNATLEHGGNLEYFTNDSSVASINIWGQISAYKAGVANITVKYAGNEKYDPDTRYVIVTVTTETNEISVGSSVDAYIDDRINLNPTLEHGGKLVYTSNDTSVVKVDSRGNITALKEGTANVTVKFEGNAQYDPDVKYVIVKVSRIPTSIDAEKSYAWQIGENGEIPATLNPQGIGTLIFTSNNESVVKVDNKGKITTVGVGKTTIFISYTGSQKYLPANKSVEVTVYSDSLPTSIEVNNTFELYVGDTVDIGAVLIPSNAGELTYTSSDENVVKIDADGKITAIAAGKANITIAFAGNNHFLANSTQISVIVSIIPTSIEANKTMTVNLTEEINLEYAFSHPQAGNLKFTYDNNIISIEDGKIKGLKVGKTNLLISFEGNEKYSASNATIEITVSDIETTIDAADEISVNLTESGVISVVLNPKDAVNYGSLEFISNDTGVVTVDANGNIKGIKVGNAAVRVNYIGNGKYRSASKTVNVIVGDIETSIDAADEIKVNITESGVISVVLNPKDAVNYGSLEFISNDTGVVTVDANGNIKGIKVGNAAVRVNYIGNGKYRSASKTVNVVVSDVETSIDTADEIKVIVTEQEYINAVLNPKEAGLLKFSSNDTSVVTVDANGKVKGIKVGSASVTISFAGNGKYRPVSKTVNVVVSDIETSIDVADEIIVNVTESEFIIASLNPNEARSAGLLKFSSNDTGIVTVDNRGNIKGIKLGTATVTISFEDKNGKYRSISKNVTVNVVDVETKITVDCDNINLIYGDGSKVNASLTPNVGNLVYESNDTGVVTVDENGNIQTVKSGVATITVSYTGKGKYRSSNKTVTVNVARAPTSISINETVKMEIGTLSSLKPVLNPRGVGKLIYTTNDNDVIELQGDGLVYTLSSGTAVVNINFAGNECYLPSNTTVTIVIDSRETEIVVNNSVVIGFGESMNLGAILRSVHNDIPMTNKLNYLSSNPEIVSVDGDGKITANKIGNAVIKISFDGVTSFKPCNATVNVKVDTRTTSVNVDYNSKTLHVDDTDSINATLVNGPKDYVFNYISNNPDIVRVNPVTGAITALSNGTAVITVRYNGDEEYHYSSADVTVTVLKYATHVNAANSYELVVYENRDLFAVVTPNEGRLTYTSSDESVVTVSNGILTAKKSGSAVVTITFEGDRKYLPSHKSVIVSVDKIPTSINLTDMTLSAGDELKLENIVLPEGVPTRAKYYEYISMDTEIFDVDNGMITTYQDGVAELYVVFKGDDIYLPSNKSVIVTVVKKVLTAEEYNLTVEVDDDAHQATFTFILPEDAEGAFTVNLNGQVYGEPIENGKAVVVIDELEPGDYTAITRYGGDIKYASMSNTTKFHLGKYKIDKNNDIDVSLGGTATYTVHLTKDTQAMEAKTITFKVNGRTYYAVTDMLGYASIKVKLPASKAYTITAQFGSVKVSNKIKVHVIVAKNLKTKKTKNLKVTISLKKVNKKYLANKKVTLKFRGKTYTAKTNKKAVATFTINKNLFSKLKVGKSYSYVVKYAKDSVTKTIKITK